MSTPNFRFKQFTVWHDKCAMKVGSDGVLLGAWAPISNQPSPITNTPFRVLDVGTGSGLIALMLAQRCPTARIDAIDIDAAAVAQAKENFEQSAFSHQLSAFCSSLQDWQTNDQRLTTNDQYDLVVSNPPYFQNSLKNPNEGRKTARHTDTLSYEELIAHSARLLKPEGQLALILPAEAELEIRSLAKQAGLILTHVTRVYSKESKPARRVLLSFEVTRSRDHEITPIESSLVLENEKGGRSAAYSELCKEFYL